MLGREGCQLHIGNIITEVDRAVEEVVDIIQEVIDDPANDIPGKVVTHADVALVQQLMAYYGNWYPTIVGLWAKVRVKAGTDKNRIAARDVLEEQAQACYRKYQAASRALTNFQEANQGQHTRLM